MGALQIKLPIPPPHCASSMSQPPPTPPNPPQPPQIPPQIPNAASHLYPALLRPEAAVCGGGQRARPCASAGMWGGAHIGGGDLKVTGAPPPQPGVPWGSGGAQTSPTPPQRGEDRARWGFGGGGGCGYGGRWERSAVRGAQGRLAVELLAALLRFWRHLTALGTCRPADTWKLPHQTWGHTESGGTHTDPSPPHSPPSDPPSLP